MLFTPSGSMPPVYILRDDFPDTAHQQLAFEGAPRAICIDDRSWAETRLIWTPAELVHRILSWFERAARGELHDARQPLDPVLFGSPLTFLISRRVLRASAERDLIARHFPEHLRFRPPPSTTRLVEPREIQNVFMGAHKASLQSIHPSRTAAPAGGVWYLEDLLKIMGRLFTN